MREQAERARLEKETKDEAANWGGYKKGPAEAGLKWRARPAERECHCHVGNRTPRGKAGPDRVRRGKRPG